jgi:hypothetical protein
MLTGQECTSVSADTQRDDDCTHELTDHAAANRSRSSSSVRIHEQNASADVSRCAYLVVVLMAGEREGERVQRSHHQCRVVPIRHRSSMQAPSQEKWRRSAGAGLQVRLRQTKHEDKRVQKSASDVPVKEIGRGREREREREAEPLWDWLAEASRRGKTHISLPYSPRKPPSRKSLASANRH